MSPSPNHALLIFNPVAGHYKPQRLRLFVSTLRGCGWEVEIAPTSYRGNGRLIAQEALKRGKVDLIIVGGGDGTLSEVAQALLGSSVPMAIFPIGSANVLARELSIPFNDKDNALMIDRVFSQSAIKTIWPGIVKAPEGQTIFIQMLGMGPDGWIVHHVSTHLKKYIGRTAYVISALQCALCYKFTPFSLTLDGIAKTATAAILTKGRYYGGKFQIIPSSPQESQSFEVILFRCKTLGSFLKAVLFLILFRKENKYISIITARNVKILPHHTIDMQIDGDGYEASEADISISDRPLRIMTP